MYSPVHRCLLIVHNSTAGVPFALARSALCLWFSHGCVLDVRTDPLVEMMRAIQHSNFLS